MGLSQNRTRLVGRLRSRKTRTREGLVLVEGVRAVEAALAAGAEVRFAVVTSGLESSARGTTLAARLRDGDGEVHEVTGGELAALADTEAPQGVLVVCAQPAADPGVVAGGRRFLVLDAVQDPGNAGTLVRAAVAFGLDAVLALDGTADPWGAKAVRASAGSAFRIPVVALSSSGACAALAGAGVDLVVAAGSGEPAAPGAVGGRWALAVGNEGAGVRAALRDAAAVTLRVPMEGPVDSLNAGVAGSILMFVLTREVAVG